MSLNVHHSSISRKDAKSLSILNFCWLYVVMSSMVSFFFSVGLLITMGGGGFVMCFVFKIIGISFFYTTTGFGMSRTSSATSSTKITLVAGAILFLLFFAVILWVGVSSSSEALMITSLGCSLSDIILSMLI